MMHQTPETLYLKRCLTLTPPSEADAAGDRERLLAALEPEFGSVEIAYPALRSLYPLCRAAGWRLTATLVFRSRGWELIRVESGDTTGFCYALAVDYGSTTVTMELVDLVGGETLASHTINNPQIAYGDEILSRIFHVKDQPAQLKALQELSIQGLRDLIAACARISGIPAGEYLGMVVAGNTTMAHFLLGLDPWTVFHTPYAPVGTGFGDIRAAELGLDLPGYVTFMPAAANYLGGDILSGLLCTDMDRQSDICVFLDIGTNGELVIGSRDFLLAGAGAAGPAFEVGVSKFGMRAERGAVTHAEIRGGALTLKTVDNAPPVGICGSGIVSLLAQLFLHGWVDARGKLLPERSPRIRLVPGENEAEYALCYAWQADSGLQEDLYFAQSDIEKFMQTKAAAHTMVASLLAYAGIAPTQITGFYLAGAFGTYTDLESAITIGLYPDLPREVFHPLGNASLQGAKKLLLDRRQAERLTRFIKDMVYVQFGEVADFVENMRAATFLPHTQQQDYPTVMERLRRIQAAES